MKKATIQYYGILQHSLLGVETAELLNHTVEGEEVSVWLLNPDVPSIGFIVLESEEERFHVPVSRVLDIRITKE